jgi:hypothetical protein
MITGKKLIKKDEVGETYSIHREHEQFSENLKGKAQLGDLSVDWKRTEFDAREI